MSGWRVCVAWRLRGGLLEEEYAEVEGGRDDELSSSSADCRGRGFLRPRSRRWLAVAGLVGLGLVAGMSLGNAYRARARARARALPRETVDSAALAFFSASPPPLPSPPPPLPLPSIPQMPSPLPPLPLTPPTSQQQQQLK